MSYIDKNTIIVVSSFKNLVNSIVCDLRHFPFAVFFDDRNITAIKNTVVPPMEAKINAHGNPICFIKHLYPNHLYGSV